VCEPLNRQYARRALAAAFPGRPALASFALRANQEKDVGDVISNIAQLTSAGFQIDLEQVRRETGYEITGFSAPAPPPGLPAAFRAAARRRPAGRAHDPLMQSGADALAQAQAAANRPLALAIARVLTAKDLPAMQAAARRLRGELPQIAAAMLSDPAQAEAYRRIMSSAFLQGLIKEPAQ
jgi:hypothetical protein